MLKQGNAVGEGGAVWWGRGCGMVLCVALNPASPTPKPSLPVLLLLRQTPATLGMALIAMGDDLGSDMAMRMMDHLLQYGDAPVRRGVPLAAALLSVSNPNMSSMDMLSRLSHDNDMEVAQNAILALGVMGAGTNNARMAGMLRNLSSYYSKEPTLLFLVRQPTPSLSPARPSCSPQSRLCC